MQPGIGYFLIFLAWLLDCAWHAVLVDCVTPKKRQWGLSDLPEELLFGTFGEEVGNAVVRNPIVWNESGACRSAVIDTCRTRVSGSYQSVINMTNGSPLHVFCSTSSVLISMNWRGLLEGNSLRCHKCLSRSINFSELQATVPWLASFFGNMGCVGNWAECVTATFVSKLTEEYRIV